MKQYSQGRGGSMVNADVSGRVYFMQPTQAPYRRAITDGREERARNKEKKIWRKRDIIFGLRSSRRSWSGKYVRGFACSSLIQSEKEREREREITDMKGRWIQTKMKKQKGEIFYSWHQLNISFSNTLIVEWNYETKWWWWEWGVWGTAVRA